MLKRIVTGANYGCIITSPNQSARHCIGNIPVHFQPTTSAGKIMLAVFWDSRGVSLAHFQKRGENVNSASYCEVLLKLLDAIRRKGPGQLTRGTVSS
jgi:hypothetical protein